MQDFESIATELHMDVLVEVHDEAELQRALQLNTSLLGINNRNLRTFEVSLDTTLKMLKDIPTTKRVVTESGILTKDDVKKMRDANVQAFLVGEAFMRQDDPGLGLKELFLVKPLRVHRVATAFVIKATDSMMRNPLMSWASIVGSNFLNLPI